MDNLDWNDPRRNSFGHSGFRSSGCPRAARGGKIRHPLDSSGQARPQVFIGKKSPVTKSENLAVVGGNYKIGDATVSVFAIGPSAWIIRKAIRIFRNL